MANDRNKDELISMNVILINCDTRVEKQNVLGPRYNLLWM